MKRWKRIERIGVEYFPEFLEEEDECYFARDYIPGAGYQASESNNLINNIKKPVERKGNPEWRYKVQAIEQFANELSTALPSNFDAVITYIPSSKTRDDANYDTTLEDVLIRLKQLKPNIRVEYPISIICTVLPSHLGGSREPTQIYSNLQWEGIAAETKIILLIDDVITTGAHYKACKKLISEHYPDVRIIALFWAKTIK